MTSASYDRAFIRDGPVSFQRASTNRKLTTVGQEVYDPKSRFKRPIAQAPFCSSTYVSIGATCPTSCRFKDAGCYVQVGITGARARKLDLEAKARDWTGDRVIEHEAYIIDRQWPDGIPQDGAQGGRDLRLHVGGDVSSQRAARVLAGAAARWRARGGGAVWTYTHRWSDIDREAWGDITVLASVESLEEAHEVVSLGYMPGFTMSNFASERAWKPKGSDLRIVPCPAQTRDRNCVTCRLCLDRKPAGPAAIAFAMHGTRAKSARRNLPVMWEQVDERLDYADGEIADLKDAIPDTQRVIDEAMEAMGLTPD